MGPPSSPGSSENLQTYFKTTAWLFLCSLFKLDQPVLESSRSFCCATKLWGVRVGASVMCAFALFKQFPPRLKPLWQTRHCTSGISALRKLKQETFEFETCKVAHQDAAFN